MQIGYNCDKKLMLRFRIDGGNFKSSYTSFSVGFPDFNMSTAQVLEELKKTKKEDKKNKYQQRFCETLELSKEIRKREPFEGLSLDYPSEPQPGHYHLSCMFGNHVQSRCIVMLSKTPEESSRL